MSKPVINEKNIKKFYDHIPPKKRSTFDEWLGILSKALEENGWEPGQSRSKGKIFVGINLGGMKLTYKNPLDNIRSSDSEDMWKEFRKHEAIVDAYYSVKRLAQDSFPFFNPEETFKNIPKGKISDELKEVLMAYHHFVLDCKEAFKFLDSVKPRPVLSSIKLSPKVTKTLKLLGITSSPNKVTVKCPKVIYEDVETWSTEKKKYVTISVPRLIWPEGIVHGLSRFKMETGHCEACGQRIRTHRFVPLYFEDGKEPKSMFVGTDCAHNLFGVKDTGFKLSELEEESEKEKPSKKGKK